MVIKFFIDMKKLLTIASALLILASCGNGTSKSSSTEGEQPTTKTEKAAKAASIKLGDKFAFAGLDSDKLVPSFAKEVSETEKSLDTDVCRGVYLYVGDNVNVITPEQLNKWFSVVYDAAKAASDDGKIYKPGAFGDTQRGDEITGPVVTDKSFGDFSCIYQHDGVWYRFDASHKVQHDKFVKEYPEKYYGVKLYVHGKYNVTE